MAQSKISNPQSSEMTDMSNNSIFNESMENPTTPEIQPIAEQSDNAQPKSYRPTAKQRKSDLEDYRKAYFGLIKLGKDNKHQVAISNDTFDRVERIARSVDPVTASATSSSTSSTSISTAIPPTTRVGSH